MYDLTGRIVTGAFAVVLIYLSVMAIKTGVIFGRGIPYKLSENRSSYLSALIAQIAFTVLLLAIAAGYEPLKTLKSMFGF